MSFNANRYGCKLRKLLVPGLDEEGASLVELALSVTILITVVFGIFAISIALYSYFYVSNAAREATRYAVVRGADQGVACSAPGYANCIAQQSDIEDYVKGLGFPGIKANNLTVTTQWITSSGAACTNDPCKLPGSMVKSTASYTYGLIIPFVPSQALTMTSTSQMVISY